MIRIPATATPGSKIRCGACSAVLRLPFSGGHNTHQHNQRRDINRREEDQQEMENIQQQIQRMDEIQQRTTMPETEQGDIGLRELVRVRVRG